MSDALLGPAEIRDLAEQLGVSPTKKLGQNFVHDPNTVRKIVRLSGISDSGVSRVLEVGPGLGSLTLGLTETGAAVTAIEIDSRLATQLGSTVALKQPKADVRVVQTDAMRVTRDELLASAPDIPTALVANLPYNVSVPILLHLLTTVPELTQGLVMVQQEVGERIAAAPGSRVYGAPSVKLAWYGTWQIAGAVSRQIFWPVPNVDSVLVQFSAHDAPLGSVEERERAFELLNAAFLQRRKMVRQSLKGELAEPAALLQHANIPETARPEELTIHDVLRLVRAERERAFG